MGKERHYMGIILDADQNQEYIEDQLKKELEKTGEIPESISAISKRKIKEIFLQKKRKNFWINIQKSLCRTLKMIIT